MLCQRESFDLVQAADELAMSYSMRMIGLGSRRRRILNSTIHLALQHKFHLFYFCGHLTSLHGKDWCDER